MVGVLLRSTGLILDDDDGDAVSIDTIHVTCRSLGFMWKQKNHVFDMHTLMVLVALAISVVLIPPVCWYLLGFLSGRRFCEGFYPPHLCISRHGMA